MTSDKIAGVPGLKSRMTQADRIRQFTHAHFVAPAFDRDGVAVVHTGDVHRAMELRDRMPAVCSALEARVFCDTYGLRLTERSGPRRGANVYLTFEPAGIPGTVSRQSPAKPAPRPLSAPPVAPLPIARPAVEAATICLVSCVASKRSRPAPARELYVSDWFGKARDYAESLGCPWFILSARYGLVRPGDTIEPYEQTLNTMPVADRRGWAARADAQLREAAPAASHAVVLAGTRYREFLAGHLTARGIRVEVPMAGLRIGEQLSWLAAQRTR